MARYRWNTEEKRLEEIGVESPDAKVHFLTDAGYENLQYMDGTDISTRKKYYQFMKDRKLTHMNDFKESWAKAEARRESVRTDGGDHEKRRRAIRAALEQPQKAVEAGQRARARPTGIRLSWSEKVTKE